MDVLAKVSMERLRPIQKLALEGKRISLVCQMAWTYAAAGYSVITI